MDWAPQLLESDRAYFEAGAKVRRVSGAVLAQVPGFETLPAGAVVHRVERYGIEPEPLHWLVRLEERLAELGIGTARLYLDAPDPAMEWALAQLGYHCQPEVGFVQAPAARRSDIVLEPIRTERGWQQKLALHLEESIGPDGHRSDAALWTALERVRQDAGYLTAHLAIRRGQVVGAVALARAGGLLRLMNLVVAPAHRRRGVGAAIVRAALTLAHHERLEAVGCFGLAGADGEALYLSTGFLPATTQFGWSRTLVPAAVPRRPWRSLVFG